MASGKSTLAKKAAIESGRQLVNIDKEIEYDHSMSISEIFDKFGEGYFRDKEREKLKEVFKSDNQIIDCGGGAAIFNPDLIKNNSYVIFVDTEFEVIWERLKDDNTRPVIWNKTKEQLKELYDNRLKIYKRIANERVSN